MARFADVHILGTIYTVLIISAISSAQNVNIVTQPSDATVLQGEDVLLRCVVENLPVDGRVQWTKGAFALGFNRQLPGFPRYSVTGEESLGEYNLMIKNLTITDEEVYECQVTSHLIRSRSAIVTVQVPPKGPAIDDAVNNVVKVRANAENLITCRSWNGKPVADLKWYKDGSPILTNVSYAVTDESHKLHNSSATLRIWPSENDDGNKYYCVLSSNVVEAPDAVAILNVQKPPVAHIVIEPSVDVLEGGSVTALCDSSSSKPHATSYAWYLNGEIISGETGKRFKLGDVSKSMNGYVIGCVARNDVGSSHRSMATLNVQYPPLLITGPSPLSVNSSQEAVFNCKWDSNPQSVVTWYKVRAGGNVLIGRGETLTISEAQQNDSGEILCVADADEVGKGRATTTLIVWGPPIIEASEIQYIQVGSEQQVVECSISSHPGIQEVTWSWSLGEVDYSLSGNQSIYVNSAGLTATVQPKSTQKPKYRGQYAPGSSIAQIVIYNVKAEDITSMFNCTIINSYGMDTKLILVQEAVISHGMNSMIPIVIGAIVGVLLMIGCVLCIVYRSRNYQHKSTKLYHENNSAGMNGTPNGRLEHVNEKNHHGNDPDSDNPSTTSSVSAAEDNDDVFTPLPSNVKSPQQHDDGYHTEEANSCNKVEKSPLVSPRSNFTNEQETPLLDHSREMMTPQYNDHMQEIPEIEFPTQLDYHDGYEDNYQPFLQMDVNDHHIIDNIPSGYPNDIPHNPYPSLGRNPHHQLPPMEYYPAMRVPSNPPSVVSSHRSAGTSPYVIHQSQHPHMLGRATPTPSQLTRGYYPPPSSHISSNYRLGSSSSSLDKSSSILVDQFDNTSKLSQPSTRLSQASRSSEMFQRPLTARMATHV